MLKLSSTVDLETANSAASEIFTDAWALLMKAVPCTPCDKVKQ